MIVGQFETLLDELGKELNINNLTPDELGCCILRFKNGIKVQLEPAQQEESLLMGIALEGVPLGRYREDLFEAALQANGASLPLKGIFAWNDKGDLLVLFKNIPMQNLNGPLLAEHLFTLAEMAQEWKEAIEQGRIPIVAGKPLRGSGPFGLI
jgi:hypothetical protein